MALSPDITNDRHIPVGLLRDLRRIDPLLEVVWRNRPPKTYGRQCFELLRAIRGQSEKREHIMFFDYAPGQESDIIRTVNAMDSHRWGDLLEDRRAMVRKFTEEGLAAAKAKAAGAADKKNALIEDLTDEAAKEKERLYSIAR
jgi:hypothetical protein